MPRSVNKLSYDQQSNCSYQTASSSRPLYTSDAADDHTRVRVVSRDDDKRKKTIVKFIVLLK